MLLGGCSGETTASLGQPAEPRPSPVPQPSALALRWAPQGPNPCFYDPAGQPVSGRVASLLADRRNREHLLVGTAGGGLWRSEDGGQTWRALTDQAPSLAIGALLQDPQDPNLFYAGTGEPVESNDAQPGRGLLVSKDGGRTFALAEGTDRTFANQAVSRLQVSREGHLLVGTYRVSQLNGSGLVPPPTGIYRSDSEGTFRRLFPPQADQRTDVTDLVELPDGTLMLACESFATPTEPPSGLWRSADGGETWGRVVTGLPAQTSRIELAVAPTDPRRLYALVEAGPDEPGQSRTGQFAGLFVSDDTGLTWALVSGPVSTQEIPQALGGQAGYNQAIVVHPDNKNIVFVAADRNALRVTVREPLTPEIASANITVLPTFYDQTVDVTKTPHPDYHALTFDAAGRLLGGNDGGVWRLDEPLTAGTQTGWTNLNGLPGQGLETVQVAGLAVDPTDTSRLYIGTQDNSTMRSEGRVWRGIMLADGGPPQVDPVNPDILYEATQDTLFRTAERGLKFPPQNFMRGLTAPRGTFNIPLKAVEDSGRTLLMAATDSLYQRYADEAAWRRLTPPQQVPASALASVPGDPGTVYVGYRDGLLVKYAHGTVAPADVGLPPLTIRGLSVSPDNGRHVYAAMGYRGLFATRNSGQLWEETSQNLPRPVWCVLATRGAVFAGTHQGVWVSRQGAAWERLGEGLPNVQVEALDLTGRMLTAGTYGRGVWQLALTGEPAVSPSATPLTRVLPLFPEFVQALQEQAPGDFTMEEREVRRPTRRRPSGKTDHKPK